MERETMSFDKVILINPPSPHGFRANRDSMGGFGQLFPEQAPIMPPLDLPYLAGFLSASGVPIEVIECEGLRLDRAALVQRIGEIVGNDGEQRSIAVLRTSAPTLDSDLEACAAIRKAHRDVALCIYGAVVPHVLQRIHRENSVDYAIPGEPDEALLEIFSGHPTDTIKGVTHRSGGQWVQNPPRTFTRDLDSIPFPKWEIFPYHEYAIPRSSTAGRLAFLPMLTSRGCPFGCHYCPYPVGQGTVWRFRSPKNVADELEHLVKDLGIQYILFRDPMFSLRIDRVRQICDEIIGRGLKFKWKCETRVDCLDEEIVRHMAVAGCDGINFGVESAEVEIQRSSGRKPISREKIIEMTRICRKYHVKTFSFFIVGLPGDTVTTILETIEFAVRLRPTWFQFTAATPFIGTKLRQWSVERGLATEDEYSYISSHQATTGNENLSKAQVESLYGFAVWIERLMNRRGILKDVNRSGLFYAVGRTMANGASSLTAGLLFAIGKLYFRRRDWGGGGSGDKNLATAMAR
jgi:anaerobic magnesium-protoporphyrin IX monomethyl ester cyclase